MGFGDTQTSVDLTRWHEGDEEALNSLLERHLAWITRKVRARIGRKLRAKTESGDIVQDALVRFLRYGPPFIVSDDRQFRLLMAHVVENVLRDKHAWFSAQRRDMERERSLPEDTVLNLDPPEEGVKTPSGILFEKEREAWIALGVELLRPRDREIVILRHWQGFTFPEIGEQYDILAGAARSRYRTALGRLQKILGALKVGDIERALAMESPDLDSDFKSTDDD